MAEDKGKKAFWKGYSDSQREMNDPPGFLDTLTGGGKVRWDPPSSEKEAYKSGWETAKKERRK